MSCAKGESRYMMLGRGVRKASEGHSREVFLAERDATFIYDGTCEKITTRKGTFPCGIRILTAPARIPCRDDVVLASQHRALATASNMSPVNRIWITGPQPGSVCSTDGAYKRWNTAFGVFS